MSEFFFRIIHLLEYFQELRQQFEVEKSELLAQWKTEMKQSKSEQNEITEQLNQIKESYTKQVRRFLENTSGKFRCLD